MANKKARWIVLAVIGAALVVAAGLTWRAWTQSPTYSLARVAEAVEKRDRYMFERHVDLDSLLTSWVADMSDGNALAAAIGTAMTTKLRQDVLHMVEDGKIDPSSQIGAALSGAMNKKLRIERDGRNGFFDVDVKTSGGAPFSLRVHMTQVPDGYWRIDRVMNAKALSAAEAAEEALKKAEKARAIEERLKKLAVVAKLHTSVSEGWSRKNRFQVRLKNDGAEEIASFRGRLRVPRAGFDEGIRGAIHLKPGAMDNAVWEFDVNRFIEETERVYALGETDDFEVRVDHVVLADGTDLARAE